ncbi:MAG: thioredoxin fold domain-containing protein [Candidatus Brocadiaceae bacterium]|nr:thioredoxin fold domain-containing protein [Candidatus Brocadiaceae bacterium]
MYSRGNAAKDFFSGSPLHRRLSRALCVPVAVVMLAVLASAPGCDKAPEGGAATPAGAPARDNTVLATVNGEPITAGDLADALAALPEPARTAFKSDQIEFLDGLIVRKLLLQEIRKTSDGEAPARDDDAAVQDFIMARVMSQVEVAEEDVRAFYEEHKDEMDGEPTFEEAKEFLTAYVTMEKQRAALKAHAGALRESAAVTYNEEWVAEQKARAADNPLDQALKLGRPVLASFGAEHCPPCVRMKPDLEALAEEYRGRAEILIIDVDDHPELAWRLKIRYTPTQIFFDASGEQVAQQVGAMSREDMVERLKALGVE